MDLVPIARILKPRGVRGELWIQRYRDGFPAFEAGSEIWADTAQGRRGYRVAEFFQYSKGEVLRLEGLDRLEAAAAMEGGTILIPADQVPPDGPDEFDTEEVLGLRVVDASRGPLGTVDAVVEGPAYWIFVIKAPAGAIEVPAVKGLGVEVDLAAGEVRVDLPTGYPSVDERGDED